MNLKTDSKLSHANLTKILDKRQRTILSYLPKYVTITISLAVLGFLSTTLIQVITGTLSEEHIGLITRSQPTLGSVIAFLLTLFSTMVMWLFVIWSLTFIPFIAFHAYKSSQKSSFIGAKNFRWIQLYSSTFLPMTIFAVAWSSITDASDVTIQVGSLPEVALVILGTLFVSITLWALNSLVPIRFVAIRLALISTMLYTSLFLTYGQGYGLASHAMVFGILMYLIFGFTQIEESWQRVATYDIDPEIADVLDEIRTQEARFETDKVHHKQKLRSVEISSEMSLAEQLTELQRQKIDFNARANEKHLQIYEQKNKHLNTMFEHITDELTEKLENEIPQRIEELKEQTKGSDAGKLYKHMKSLRKEIESSLKGLPESIEDIRVEMLDATRRMEEQTLSLTNETISGREEKELNELITKFGNILSIIEKHPEIEMKEKTKLINNLEEIQDKLIDSLHEGSQAQVHYWIDLIVKEAKKLEVVSNSMKGSQNERSTNTFKRYSNRIVGELNVLVEKALSEL